MEIYLTVAYEGVQPGSHGLNCAFCQPVRLRVTECVAVPVTGRLGHYWRSALAFPECGPAALTEQGNVQRCNLLCFSASPAHNIVTFNVTFNLTSTVVIQHIPFYAE